MCTLKRDFANQLFCLRFGSLKSNRVRLAEQLVAWQCRYDVGQAFLPLYDSLLETQVLLRAWPLTWTYRDTRSEKKKKNAVGQPLQMALISIIGPQEMQQCTLEFISFGGACRDRLV
jgi:hypothetical protein